MRILLVEDDPNLGLLMQDFLELRGHAVARAQDGAEGLHLARTATPEVCILDVMLPKMDGFELARRIRAEQPAVPILFLTAKSRLPDKLEGFQAGADDYITKPFSMEELLVRIQAVCRRYAAPQSEAPAVNEAITLGTFTLDPLQRRLAHPSEPEPRRLSEKEARLLCLLAAHRNRLLPRDLALREVWGADNYYTARSMDVYISRLRKYLRADAQISIENVHGSGYMLVAN